MTKQRLLELFEMHKGEYLSGQTIAEDLGISRTAIWKQIHALKEEGYDIESVKKKGYRLKFNSDILSHAKVKQFLTPDLSIDQVYLYKTIDSTNQAVYLESMKTDARWLIVASEKQEKGQAKNQMTFDSPDGKGVYMSVMIRMKKPLDTLKTLLNYNSQAVQQAILKVSGVEGVVNEENNILYNNRKLCGIMTEVIVEAESQTIRQMMVGIGIYVHEASKDHIALTEITGQYCNRSELIAYIINELYAYYHQQKSCC